MKKRSQKKNHKQFHNPKTDMAAFDETDKSKPSTSIKKMSDLDELEEFDPKVES